MWNEITNDLVELAAAGCREAENRLLEVLAPQVERMVLVRLAPAPWQMDAVGDIAQNVLIGVLQGLPTLRVRTAAGLRSFVSTIVDRRVADHLRGRTVHRTGGPLGPAALDRLRRSTASMSLLHRLQANGVGPATEIAGVDQFESVLRGLGELSAVHRDVIVLAFFDQLSTAQVAAHLQISRRAASMLLLRALRSLRRRLGAPSGVRMTRRVG